MDVHEVGHGEYDDYRIAAVFADQADAQAFVDHWNLTHLDDIHHGSSPMRLGGTIPFYGPGQWRPDPPEVIDGAIVDRRALPADGGTRRS
jgi:hypothetical protein